MLKGVPLKPKDLKTKIKNEGEMIRSYRISKNMTQHTLSLAIGAYVAKSGDNQVCKYERRIHLPCVKYIYMLSEVLDIDKESFFRMVLREHYNKFTTIHHELFFRVINEKEVCDYKNAKVQYYFCREGKIECHFGKSSGIMRDAFYKKNIPYKKMIADIVLQKAEDHRCSVSHIHGVIQGKRVPSVKVVIDLCEYLGLRPFEVYKIVVEEKALA